VQRQHLREAAREALGEEVDLGHGGRIDVRGDAAEHRKKRLRFWQHVR